MPTTLCIQACVADMLARFVSTEETRYYLTGFLAEKSPAGKGVVCAATDGHRLLAIHDVHGSLKGDPAIVRLANIKPCRPDKKDRLYSQRRWLVVDGDHKTSRAVVVLANEDQKPLALAETNGPHVAHQEFNVLVDGTFPDWRRTVGPSLDVPKRNTPYPWQAFLGRYLADYTLNYRLDENGHFEADPRWGAQITIVPAADHTGPATIHLPQLGDRAHGILMPQKEWHEYKQPEFVFGPFKKSEAA